jgi:hypothetical protein
MIMKRSSFAIIVSFLLIVVFSGTAFGWSIETHKFIAARAEIGGDPAYAGCPDTCNDESSDILEPLHWYNTAPGTRITADYLDDNMEAVTLKLYPYLDKSGPIEVAATTSTENPVGYTLSLEQKRLPYLLESQPLEVMIPYKSGALYWVILKLYQDLAEKKAMGERRYYSTIAHFVGDLSNPLHNFPHGDEIASDGKYYQREGEWATEVVTVADKKIDRHQLYDKAYEGAIVEKVVPTENPSRFFIDYVCANRTDKEAFDSTANSTEIRTIDDLKERIAKIANCSIRLANRCYRTKKDMSERQARDQLILSVSLIRDIKKSIEKLPENSPPCP